MIRLIIDICLIVAVIFALAGTLGILRMPDVFCRLQASTCIPTLGTIFVVIAGIFYAAKTGMDMSIVLRILFLGAFVLLTNPISNHALLKGAYKNGDLPETKLTCDDYRDDEAGQTEEVVMAAGEEVSVDE